MIELSLQAQSRAANVGFAGDSLNTAVYLQRALEDAGADDAHSVSYVTAIGTDSFSDQMHSLIENENIDTTLVVRCEDHVPGLYAINTDSAGERSFTYWRDQSAARTLFSPETGPDFQQLSQFDLIYYSAISLAILPDAVKQQWLGFLEGFQKQPGKLVAFDSNYRPKLWESAAHARQYTKAAFVRCDLGFPSLDDEMALFQDKTRDDVIARLQGFGLTRGILKCGSLGPVDLADPLTEHSLPQASKVVDSTAAGDSFNGAYLASLAQGKATQQCIADAHACAKRVISYPGGIIDRKLWQSA